MTDNGAMASLHLIIPDPVARRAVVEQTRLAGIEATAFATLDEARAAWGTGTPSVVVFDEEALGDGLTEAGEALRLVLGTAEGRLQAEAVTEGFPKPVRLGYLLARVQFYLQAQQQATNVSFALGPYRFAPRTRLVTDRDGGEVAQLTDKESSLLEYLCRAEQPVARDEILAAVWGYDGSIDTHTLETHLYRLRRAVPDGRDLFVTDDGRYGINPAWRTA